jgi:threonine synthase
MKYFSLNGKAPDTSFAEAVIRGIAPDRGLYFPEKIPHFGSDFWKHLSDYSIPELGVKLMHPFVGDSINHSQLEKIILETLDFDIPLVQLKDNLFALELYHGPTMAFKDVGARFMARCLGYLMQDSKEEVTVLVATSGDTGGAVANGFFQVPGVRVVILYPEGKVSAIQEKQLTTLGHNISALKVNGSFDDCQQMVKQAFLDPELSLHLKLTSANSINIARWIPQLLYYAIAYRQLNSDLEAPIFSVPSGNFGNICAGMLAHKMGMPCRQFIAATNVNDTVPRYMQEQRYTPHPTRSTLSNAMDVSDPSNFVRVLQLFNEKFQDLAAHLTSKSYTDAQTLEGIQKLYEEYKYIADPHGAIGYLGLLDYSASNPEYPSIFLETAHPIKFKDTVEQCLNITLPIPEQIQKIIGMEGNAISVQDYADVKAYLLSY